MTLNGLYILMIVLVAIIYCLLGYSWGKSVEKKKINRELRILNQKINELLDNKRFEPMSPKDFPCFYQE